MENLPAEAAETEPLRMNRALALWFDDNFFTKAKTIATYMAKAEGFTPKHLVNKPEACFLVVELALNWNLSPSRVAACTYVTPNGAIGFEGKLIHAIIEATGRLQGAGVTYEHFYDVTMAKGEERQRVSTVAPALDEPAKFISRIAELRVQGWHIAERHGWEGIQGKFEMKKVKKQGSRGEYEVQFAAPAWNPADEKGLGVMVRAHIKGELEPRKHPFLLVQAQPRNSTLWATDPSTQICYLAARRFANLAMPHILMGVPFDREAEADVMVDVTPPRPDRADFEPAARTTAPVTDVEDPSGQTTPIDQAGGAAREPQQQKRHFPRVNVLDMSGEDAGSFEAPRAAAVIGGMMRDKPAAEIIAVYEHNADTIAALESQGIAVEDLHELYREASAPPAESDVPAHDPETGELTEDEARPARNKFWSRERFFIELPVDAKGKKDYLGWAAQMRNAAGDAETLEELTRLDEDNKPRWSAFMLAMRPEAEKLRTFFADRARALGAAQE